MPVFNRAIEYARHIISDSEAAAYRRTAVDRRVLASAGDAVSTLVHLANHTGDIAPGTKQDNAEIGNAKELAVEGLAQHGLSPRLVHPDVMDADRLQFLKEEASLKLFELARSAAGLKEGEYSPERTVAMLQYWQEQCSSVLWKHGFIRRSLTKTCKDATEASQLKEVLLLVLAVAHPDEMISHPTQAQQALTRRTQAMANIFPSVKSQPELTALTHPLSNTAIHLSGNVITIDLLSPASKHVVSQELGARAV